jgi:hypothetical protein
MAVNTKEFNRAVVSGSRSMVACRTSHRSEHWSIMEQDFFWLPVPGSSSLSGDKLKFPVCVSFFALLTCFSVQAQDRNAIVFDGFDDYVVITDSGQLDFGTGDFTVSAWVKTSQAPVGGNLPMIINKEHGSLNRSGYELFLQPNGGLNGKVIFQIASDSILATVTSTSDINDGAWHHVAGIKRAAEIELVVDGISEGTTAHTLGSLSSDVPFSFGRASAINAWYFGGVLMDARVWSVARSAAEILADMNTTLTGQEPNLVAYWPMDEEAGQTISDLAGANDGQLGSSAQADVNDPLWVSEVFPHDAAGENSLVFDGANDYVIIPDSEEVDFDTEDFTVSAWIKTRQFPSGNYWPIILSKESGLSTARTGYNMFLLPSPPYASGQVIFQIWSNGAATGALSNRPINDGRWHHVVGIKTSNQVELYVDGKSESKSAHNLGTVSNSEPLHIGSFSAPLNWFYQGLVDDVRIWNEARSEHEVLEEYFNRLTGGEPNLAGHWRFNDGAGQSALDETGINHGQLGSTAAPDLNDPMWISTNYPVIFFRDGFED